MDTTSKPSIMIPYNMPMINIPARYIEIATRTILIGIFGISALIKGVNFDETIITILGYDIIGIEAARYFAYFLLGLEALLVVWLAIGWNVRLAYQVVIVVFTIFIMLIISAWARGLEIDCGCFGYNDPPENPQLGYLKDIFRDAVFTTVAALGMHCLSMPGQGRRSYLL